MIKIKETDTIGSIYKIYALEGRKRHDEKTYIEISRNFRNVKTGDFAYFVQMKSGNDEAYIALTEEEMLEFFSSFLAVKKDYEEYPIREV